MNYRETDWANRFQKRNPDEYDMAIRLAEDPDLVVNVFKVHEVGWVIEPRNLMPDFWLGIHTTREEAINQCFELGWYIR